MGDKINFVGVRIDSGDLAYVSKGVRKMLDEAGFKDASIVASNDLDETTIKSLKFQDAKIDTWGIGTKLITAYDQAALGGVYKVVSVEDENGQMTDTIKISGTAEKISTPGQKQVWRITRNSDGKSQGDYVALWDENPQNLPNGLYMFHPNHTYLSKTVVDYTARPILKDIFVDGELVYELPSLDDIREFTKRHVNSLYSEYRRDMNPQEYPVDLSQAAWDHKMNLIKATREYVDQIDQTQE